MLEASDPCGVWVALHGPVPFWGGVLKFSCPLSLSLAESRDGALSQTGIRFLRLRFCSFGVSRTACSVTITAHVWHNRLPRLQVVEDAWLGVAFLLCNLPCSAIAHTRHTVNSCVAFSLSMLLGR